jgi:hypothetical protein
MNSVRVWPKGKLGFFKKLRVTLKQVVKSGFWDNFMTGCVLANTVTMAMERYSMPPQEAVVIEIINEIFTYIFIFEMTCKLIAIGVTKYHGDYNR